MANAAASPAPTSIRIWLAAPICASRPTPTPRASCSTAGAVGVEYRQGKELRQIRARREVILAAGAFPTPQLLMLSGIGDSAEFGKHGIAAVRHAPGVGQNLQDHPDFVFGYMSDNPNFNGISLKRCRGCCERFDNTAANAPGR